MYESSQLQGAKPPNLPDPHVCSRSCARHQIMATPLMSYHYRVEVQKKTVGIEKLFKTYQVVLILV